MYVRHDPSDPFMCDLFGNINVLSSAELKETHHQKCDENAEHTAAVVGVLARECNSCGNMYSSFQRER